ncbi:MAG: hypothetical protein QM765_36125 [Myxococcales bacterium]
MEPSLLTRRLTQVCARVVEAGTPSFLIERFHLSYFALVPRWELYRDLDAKLAAEEVGLVLLRIADEALRERSLMRREHGGTDWQGFIAHYGSEQRANDALKASQDRRLEALARTRMRHLVIDTGGQDWEAYASGIASWAG